MNSLPWWMQWAQAVALIIISGLGAWIAFKQVRIASAKLNFDLYAKRFAIFEAARTYLSHFEVDGQVSLKEIGAFRIGYADAVFLFDDSVVNYLDELRMLGARHDALRKKLNWPGMDDDARGRTADELADIETAVTNTYPRLIATFKPYLLLHSV